MFETLRRAFRLPELRNRILFTLMMFVVIRLGTYIPVPGIDRAAVAQLVGKGGFLGLLDLFSGGGIANFAIFSLSVLPYINASIIIELLGSVIPALEELRRKAARKVSGRLRSILAISLLDWRSSSRLASWPSSRNTSRARDSS